jgi:diguanylate cyclase (GGDEF)-like protein
VAGEDCDHRTAEIPGAYSDIERAAKEGYSLDSLSETIASMTVVRDIAVAATEMLESQIQPSTAFFWSLKGDQLVTYDELNQTVEESVPLGVGVHGWVAVEQSPCINLDVTDGPFSGCKVVAVPVLLEGRTIGVLSLYREETSFTDDDVRLVTATGDRIRGSVRYAQELEAVKRDAGSDKLTGLANRHSLEAAFATLEEHSYSVVLIDVDCFKRVNDEFGHQAGDHVLVRLAAHFRRAFPTALSACRLGGDEFVVLLPCSYFKAHKMTREFRRRVEDDPDFDVYRKLGFGVSWGIAAAPEDALSLDDVMAEADRRMYGTKARQKSSRAVDDVNDAPGPAEVPAPIRTTL